MARDTAPSLGDVTVLRELDVAAPAGAWAAAGFAVGGDDTLVLGGVALRLAGDEGAITGWALEGVTPGDLDGLATREAGPAVTGAAHPNGALAVDHVVARTPDLARTLAALAAAGLEPRRVREAGDGVRQAFFVLGTALLELVGPAGEEGPAAFWGLTLVVADLDAAVRRIPSSPARPAVQPGRRIATVRPEAGLGVPVALMTPRS